jgi:ribose 5-phosphate isomerase A
VNERTQRLKQKASRHAVGLVKPGMVVGLGAGTTAAIGVRCIAQRLVESRLHDILGVPCSREVEEQARALCIPLTTLNEHPVIDLTIDGADEVDPNLNLIKGGGGALLREKIVAQVSHREVIVVDESKLSPALGTRWPVPVEVIPFGWRAQVAYLESLGAEPSLRIGGDGIPFRTDQGNLILDCNFGAIADPVALAAKLNARAGIVAHGLFIGLATDVIVAGEGSLRHLRAQERP